MNGTLYIQAIHLRLGDNIVRPGPKGVMERFERVTSLDFVGCRNHVHVNGVDCYDALAVVLVRRG